MNEKVEAKKKKWELEILTLLQDGSVLCFTTNKMGDNTCNIRIEENEKKHGGRNRKRGQNQRKDKNFGKKD